VFPAAWGLLGGAGHLPGSGETGGGVGCVGPAGGQAEGSRERGGGGGHSPVEAGARAVPPGVCRAVCGEVARRVREVVFPASILTNVPGGSFCLDSLIFTRPFIYRIE
jgi:hypothetical protein